MKVLNIIAGVVVTAAAVVAINTATAGATGTGNCDIPKLKLGEPHGQKMVEKNGKITATFTVTGKNCKTPVTLAVWKSPAKSVDKIGETVNEQKLYHYTTEKFGPGTHKIEANLPDCFWQADLLVGSNPTAPDGTANYAFQNGKILEVHPLRDFKFGGNKKCKEPKPEKDVCPNLDGMYKEVPEGYMIDEEGNCVLIPEDEPVQPEKETEPQILSTQTPEALPKTGAAAIATVFAGVSTLSAAAHAIFRKFLS